MICFVTFRCSAGALLQNEELPPQTKARFEREAQYRRNVALAARIRYVLKEDVGASLYRDDLSYD